MTLADHLRSPPPMDNKKETRELSPDLLFTYEKSQEKGLDNIGFVADVKVDLHNNNELQKVPEEEDPWDLPELQINVTPWSELSAGGRVKRVAWHYCGKVVLLLAFLYLFICSLGFLGDAFKLLGGKAAGEVFTQSEVFSNPVAGVMIGVLATVLFQSSSTTTSIVVSMVAEQILTVQLAIPIIMGANIGTSVTNTIVAIGQIANKDQFRRAFAGATVHDMFNWLTVLILLPIELLTGYLRHLSQAMVDNLHLAENQAADQDYLKTITNPLTKLIIQVDKDIIQKVAQGDEEAAASSIIKHCCDKTKVYRNETVETLVNGTLVTETNEVQECHEYCQFLFESVSRDDGWSDVIVGVVLLALALTILCICLVAIVKLLTSLLQGQIAIIIRKFVNANFPGKICGYLTGYFAIVIGAGLTFLVQSSSILTSSLTPLVGLGVISMDRMYPLTLGSNIGTTTTGVLAAFAQDAANIPNALQISLCHLFFNISGIVIFYPIPKFRPAINMAKFLGQQTAKYRWFAVVYLFFMFFILPAAGFGLSLASWIVFAVVFIPVGIIIILVGIVKLLQAKKPELLPPKLRTWDWLPVYLRSLAPLDRAFLRVTGNCYCCRKLGCCKGIYVEESDSVSEAYEAPPPDYGTISKISNDSVGFKCQTRL